jgi:hypothetical protein
MNFNELFQKMKELDQPVNEEPNEGNAFSGALDDAKDAGKDEFKVGGKTFQVKEDDIDECGMDMPSMSSPKQQDNVTMNISMNGSGAGGIRDLMNLLRDLEDGPDEDGMGGEMGVIINKMAGDDHDSEMPLIGMEEAEAGGFDQASTTPDPQVAPASAAFPTGNDIHSHGGNERPKVNGGGNPYAMTAESLIPRLANLYQEVKSR